MITLVDQSESEKLKFHCDVCNQIFVQPSRYFLDLHTPYPNPEAQKRGVPICQAVAVAPAAPKVRKVKLAPKPEVVPAPKKRGRPRKAEVAP